MTHMVLLSILSLVSLGWPFPQPAQPWASDDEVARGIQLVEEGDYDTAIVTLDRAARRLAESPDHARVLSYAYLYLGIAYLGKGHEAAAKAQFREAIGQVTDLSLSPEEYPPKVINLFEAAREESRETTTEPEAVAPPAEGVLTPEKKEGSKMPLILVGAGGAAAAGIGVAMAGGESGETPQPIEPAPPPTPTMKSDVFPGILNRDQPAVEILVGPGGGGRWEAQVNYTNPEAQGFWMEIYTEDFVWVTDGRAMAATSYIAEWETEGGRFWVKFGFDPDLPGPDPGNYELRVTYPVP